MLIQHCQHLLGLRPQFLPSLLRQALTRINGTSAFRYTVVHVCTLLTAAFSHRPQRSSVQERYDSLTNSVKESTIIEPSIAAPATGKKVSIPDVFNSPNSTPGTSPAHVATPRNGVVGVARREGGPPAPSPRTRRKVAEGSPIPSPKTVRKVRLKPERGGGGGGEMVVRDPHQGVENGQNGSIN